MAMKIGKNEKIVIGVVLGLAAIVLCHFFVFMQPSQSLAAAKQRRDSLVYESNSLPLLPNQDVIDEFNKATYEDEGAFWRAALEMNVILNPIFFSDELPDPPPPADIDKPEVKAAYDDYIGRRRIAYRHAALNVILKRFERMIDMKRAYEAGENWVGDPPVQEGEDALGVMRLSFLEANPNGWHIPVELPAAQANNKPKLWDDVNKLYESHDLLKVLDPNELTFASARFRYDNDLRAIGLNINAFPNISVNISQQIPLIVRILYARLIWAQREENQTVRVGLSEELTYPLLKEMLGANFEEYQPLRNLNQQLEALDHILPLARKVGVQNVTMVRLPQLTEEFKKMEVDATPRPMDMPEFFEDPSMMGMMGYDAPGGGAQGPSPAAAEGKVIQNVSIGFVSIVGMQFECTNKSLVHFLYEIANSPQHFRLEKILIDSLTGTQSDMVRVDIDLTMPLQFIGISDPYSNLFDYTKFEPIPIVDPTKKSLEIYKARMDTMRKRGFDLEKIIQDSFQEMGYVSKAFEMPKPGSPDAAARPREERGERGERPAPRRGDGEEPAAPDAPPAAPDAAPAAPVGVEAPAADGL